MNNIHNLTQPSLPCGMSSRAQGHVPAPGRQVGFASGPPRSKEGGDASVDCVAGMSVGTILLKRKDSNSEKNLKGFLSFRGNDHEPFGCCHAAALFF